MTSSSKRACRSPRVIANEERSLPHYPLRSQVLHWPVERGPRLTTLDFEELRNATIFEIWRHRRMGLNFEVFSLKPGSG